MFSVIWGLVQRSMVKWLGSWSSVLPAEGIVQIDNIFPQPPASGCEGNRSRPMLILLAQRRFPFTKACWDSSDSSKKRTERTLSNLIPSHVSVQQPDESAYEILQMF